MMLCDLTTCYSIEIAWFQRLKLKYDKPLSNLAFDFNLRRYSKVDMHPSSVNSQFGQQFPFPW
jgi:hypothetical protein